jgi:hypothetical protein
MYEYVNVKANYHINSMDTSDILLHPDKFNTDTGFPLRFMIPGHEHDKTGEDHQKYHEDQWQAM